MSTLLFAKVAAVFSVVYAGMNLYQFTSSYAHLVEKIGEFREAAGGEEGRPRLARLNIVFYLLLPAGYLALCRGASLAVPFLVLMGAKFLASAALGLWTERGILDGPGYTPRLHWLGRMDNLLNLGIAGGVVYLLLKGAE